MVKDAGFLKSRNNFLKSSLNTLTRCHAEVLGRTTRKIKELQTTKRKIEVSISSGEIIVKADLKDYTHKNSLYN